MKYNKIFAIRTNIALKLKNPLRLKCEYWSSLFSAKILMWVPSTQPITPGKTVFSKKYNLVHSSSDISNFIHCGQNVNSEASRVSAYILETADCDRPKLKSFSTLTWYEPCVRNLKVIANFIIF